MPEVAKWVLKGYQADIDAQQRYTGQIYEERGRGFLAMRGQIGYIGDGKKTGAIGSVGDSDEFKKLIKVDDWNDIHIIAAGNIDHPVDQRPRDEPDHRRRQGGPQDVRPDRDPITQNPGPMKIESRNIRLKEM